MKTIAQQNIYDARQLGVGRFTILGVQHLFAMFGATILVPALTGLSVSATLLFAGVGTLLFHFVSKKMVPAFLGSSFAFIGGYATIKQLGVDMGMAESLALDYACVGVFCAAMLYLVMAGLIKLFGSKNVLKFFPPVVTGPMVIAIGLTLSGSAITNCATNWVVALVAMVTVIAISLWAKGILKVIPILIGVLVSYVLAAVMGEVDFSSVADAAWIGLPVARENTILAVFDNFDASFLMTSIIAIVPIAIATIMEHIGDMVAISSTVGKDFLANPGLHRTLMGDGLATAVASLFGAPANTTYGENTGVLNLTRVFDPAVIRLAAVFSILLSFCPKFACIIGLMPAATIGGVSLILYGMISAVGIRNLVESRVDLSRSRNVFTASIILVIAIGVKYGLGDNVSIGSVHLSGLALAALAGVVLNAIFSIGEDKNNGEGDVKYMRMAIDEAREGIEQGHGGPFGSVIVKDGKIVGRGHNCVLKNNDPTCHGEVAAIRDACANLGTFDLQGCTIYTTGEPCHMCLCACMWANIDKVYYGCTIEDNGLIGFRDDKFDKIFGGREKLTSYLSEFDREECLKLFMDYSEMDHKSY